MDNDIKNEAESTPLGCYTVSFLLREYSLKDVTQNQISETFSSFVREQKQRGLREIEILRGFRFAEDFGGEVAKWQRALGEPIGYTNDSTGVAAGKTFAWGDGNPMTTYAVIVATAGIGAAFLAGNPLAKGMLIHELAHVCDDFHLIREKLHLPSPKPSDLPKVLNSIAGNIRSEAFAEMAAAPYWPQEQLPVTINVALDMAKAAYERAGLAISTWQEDRDTWKLWVEILEPVSSLCSQFGRLIGLFSAAQKSGETEVKRFLESLETVDDFLPKTFQSMQKHCLNLLATQQLSIEAFKPLENTILDLFVLVGIFPEMRDRGLFVQVA